jgi:hypothetical protein
LELPSRPDPVDRAEATSEVTHAVVGVVDAVGDGRIGTAGELDRAVDREDVHGVQSVERVQSDLELRPVVEAEGFGDRQVEVLDHRAASARP